MPSDVLAILAVVGVVVLLLVYAYWKEGPGYFESIVFTKGALPGILAVTFIVVIAVALSGCVGMSVGAGVDVTKDTSPQCQSDGPSDRLTSNIRFKATHWESIDGRLKLNSQYTHHSCALNSDRNGYDGFGGEIEYEFF